MDTLYFYTVYENRSDYPGKFVVRRFYHVKGADGLSKEVYDPEPMIVADNIDQAREIIPAGCYNIGRMNNDDPVIKEFWL